MKKTITFLLLAALAVGISAQRISTIEVEGVQASTPVGAFNPTNNDANKPGDAQVVFPAGTDLSNVNVTVNVGADAAVVDPIPLPTDWTSTVEDIKVEKDDKTAWAMYNITLKVIKPADLPLEITTGGSNFDSNSWTTETVGWAGGAIDKNQKLIRFGSAKRSFVIAFNDTPDSLYYTLKFLAVPWDTENVFDVDGSADGVSWTSIHQYNADNEMPGSSPAVVKGVELDPSYRYVRWLYTTRKSANVSLENILVTKAESSAVANQWTSKVQFIPVGKNALQLTSNQDMQNLRIYDITGTLVSTIENPNAKISFNKPLNGMYIGVATMIDGSKVSKKIIF